MRMCRRGSKAAQERRCHLSSCHGVEGSFILLEISAGRKPGAGVCSPRQMWGMEDTKCWGKLRAPESSQGRKALLLLRILL